jgi:hypothetical protein
MKETLSANWPAGHMILVTLPHSIGRWHGLWDDLKAKTRLRRWPCFQAVE